MDKFSILILEDNLFQRMQLEEVLTESGYEVVSTSNFIEAIDALERNKIDLAILDVVISDSSGKGGKDVAQIINEKFNIPFIYITFYGEETFESIVNTSPETLLTKPINKNQLLYNIKITTSKHYRKTLKKGSVIVARNSIYVKETDIYEKCRLKDVVKISANNNDILIYIDNLRKHQTRSSFFLATSIKLGEILKLLPSNFIRVHKSFIINLEKLNSYDKGNHKVQINNEWIKVGSTYWAQLESKLL